MMADLPWIGTSFTVVRRSDGYITGIVDSEDELTTLLENFKRVTLTAYNKWSDHVSESSKARLLWQVEDFSDHVPLCVTRRIILTCQHGKGYIRRAKECERGEHVNANRRFPAHKGKKVDCPAKLFIRYVTRFDTYCVRDDPSRAHKEDAMRRLKLDAAHTDPPHSTFIHVKLPLEEAHRNHPSGAAPRNIHPKVKDKIHEVVGMGISAVGLVKDALNRYVLTELCARDLQQPHPDDRAYFPSNATIHNHIHMALVAGRYLAHDQEHLQGKVCAWKTEDDGHDFFLRRCTKVQKEGTADQFLFIHQHQKQMRLLKRYGETVLLDVAHKTSKYPLPLFFLGVRTNVGYQPVAQFICETETMTSIAEALDVLKSWNPEWTLKCFMTHYSQQETEALADAFPSAEMSSEVSHGGDAKWCRVYAPQGCQAPVRSSGGAQTINEDLKPLYLKVSSSGTLSSLVETVVTEFIPEKMRDYERLNYRHATAHQDYSQDVPPFLQNRPRAVVLHCLSSISSASTFSRQDVVEKDDGVFLVRSEKADAFYSVSLKEPRCECDTFHHTLLPCKHMFTIFKWTNYTWDSLPSGYTGSPYLTLDTFEDTETARGQDMEDDGGDAERVKDDGGDAERVEDDGERVEDDGGEGERVEDDGERVEDDGGDAERVEDDGGQGERVEDDGERVEDDGERVEDDGGDAERVEDDGGQGERVEDDGERVEDDGERVEDDGGDGERVEDDGGDAERVEDDGERVEGDGERVEGNGGAGERVEDDGGDRERVEADGEGMEDDGGEGERVEDDGGDGERVEDEGGDAERVEDDGERVEDDGGEGERVEDDGERVEDDGERVEDDGERVEDNGGAGERVEDDGGDGERVEADGEGMEDDGGEGERVEDDGGEGERVEDDGGEGERVEDDGGEGERVEGDGCGGGDGMVGRCDTTDIHLAQVAVREQLKRLTDLSYLCEDVETLTTTTGTLKNMVRSCESRCQETNGPVLNKREEDVMFRKENVRPLPRHKLKNKASKRRKWSQAFSSPVSTHIHPASRGEL